MKKMKTPEASRLEHLWGKKFGDAYVERNPVAGNARKPFWDGVLNKFPAKSALEIGCNLGGNLRWLVDRLPPGGCYGVDINAKALATLHRNIPGVNAVLSPARALPFRDSWFDLVFTMGVLIHQPPETLPLVMSEAVRCSRRYILCGEYYSETPKEVAYRGETGALFKRDFGSMYAELFPELALRKKGFLSKAEGWDDITYWIFEKTT